MLTPTPMPAPTWTPIRFGLESRSVLGLTPPPGTALIRVATHGKSVQVFAAQSNGNAQLLGSVPNARINELAVFGAKTPVKFVGGREFKVEYVSKPALTALDAALAEWTVDQPVQGARRPLVTPD